MAPQPRRHPLLVPEILDLICDSLSWRTLTICLRVSRAWYQAIAPKIWCSPVLECPHDLDPNKNNSPSSSSSLRTKNPPPPPFFFSFERGLQSYSWLLQSLEIHTIGSSKKADSLLQDPGFTCPHLRVLRFVQFSVCRSHEGVSPGLVTMIRRHQSTLREFVTNCSMSAPVSSSSSASLPSCASSESINSDDEKKDNSNTSNIGLLDALKDCPNLEILGLRKVDHSPEQWLDFYDTLWSRLRILSLGGEENDDDFADFGTWFQNRMHSNLSKRLRFLKESECPQDLTLFTRRSNTALDEFQMFLLLMFPGLKRLTWQLAVGYYPIDNHNRNRNHHDAEDDEVNIRNHYECKTPMSILAFMTVAETRDRLCLRHLESLTVPNRYFDSLDFKIVIEFMLHLRELDLRGTNFDESSWITLKATDRYQYQLRVLNIHNCSQVTGAVIQDMLSSMPNLEVLEADYITDSDILQDRLQPQLQSHQPPSLQPRPWVCLGLKTLNLAILIFEQPTMTTQPMILDRIATLEKLECWNMIIPYTVLERIVHDRTDSGDYQSYNDDNGDKETNLESHYLRLTLEQGLDRLKDLSHLKHILVSMSSSLAPWSESEARWVKRHWKDLEGMCGFVLDDKAREILWAQVKIY